MDRYSYGSSPIIIADRGFASFNVFAHASENDIDFVIRAKDMNVQQLLGFPAAAFSDKKRQKKNRKGSVPFMVVGNTYSVKWKFYFWFHGEK